MRNSDDTPLVRAAVFARGQHRNVTTKELRAAGFSPRMITSACDRGSLHRVFPCVYTLGPPPSMPLERAMAAVLAGRPTGLLSHHWCRWLFGVGRLPTHGPDVTIVGNREVPGITFHRTKLRLEPDANHGIPCTRPERMLIDCAGAPDLRRLVNDVQTKRLTTAERILAAVDSHPGRTTATLRALVTPEGATRSLLEDLLYDLHRTHGLPRPLLNAIVEGREVDAAYPDHSVVIEVDGYEFHHSKQQFQDDRAKRLELEAKGQRVLWVGYRQLTELRDRTAAQLIAILS
jgi:hypothetical protein